MGRLAIVVIAGLARSRFWLAGGRVGERDKNSLSPGSVIAPNPAPSADDYLRLLCFPQVIDGRTVVAAGDLRPGTKAAIRAIHGDAHILPCSPKLVLEAIEEIYRLDFQQRAVTELERCEPHFSAKQTITPRQVHAIFSVAAVLIIGSAFATQITIFIAVVFLGVAFTANALFRGVLLWIGADTATLTTPFNALAEEELPVYSILVPLYREANVMPELVRALRALDYPRRLLDIKLIVEADDCETVLAAEAACADPRFSIVRVPPGSPRTKPRACNYAMPFVLGEFMVIFDAEDRPEPDQLRKAVAAFRHHPASVACLQARLNFFNANENWLTNGLMAQVPQG